MPWLARWVTLGKTVVRVAYESNVKYLAASVAYYAFISLVPLLVLVFAILGKQLANDIADLPARFVTPGIQELIDESLTTATGRTWAVTLSVLVLAWGAANITVDFLTGIERIEAAAERRLSVQLRDAAIVLGTLSLAILAILAQSLLLAVLPVGPLGILFGYATLFAVLTAIFLPLYAIPSREVPSFPAALPGALTTAFGWTVLHAVIQFYTANAAQYAVYGVLSGVILILTSTYAAAAVLLVGVVVNAIVAEGES